MAGTLASRATDIELVYSVQLDAAGSTDPHAIATHLVAFANQSGGMDNITVALARLSAAAPA